MLNCEVVGIGWDDVKLDTPLVEMDVSSNFLLYFYGCGLRAVALQTYTLEVRMIYLGKPLISKPEPAACPKEQLLCQYYSTGKNHLIFLVLGILTPLTTVFSFSLFLV